VEVSVQCPLIRVQLRTPSPLGKQQRSGAILVDVHSLRVGLSSAPVQVRWSRLLVALSNVGGKSSLYFSLNAVLTEPQTLKQLPYYPLAHLAPKVHRFGLSEVPHRRKETMPHQRPNYRK
jgi:hypothetical protein